MQLELKQEIPVPLHHISLLLVRVRQSLRRLKGDLSNADLQILNWANGFEHKVDKILNFINQHNILSF